MVVNHCCFMSYDIVLMTQLVCCYATGVLEVHPRGLDVAHLLWPFVYDSDLKDTELMDVRDLFLQGKNTMGEHSTSSYSWLNTSLPHVDNVVLGDEHSIHRIFPSY
uniref:Secreted protein n=1 Tax=Achlya hypogyna TaxID=1202772 RepID=A0A0A7CPE2_ACHHY|nr:secreted protein [Achlya hypogyna]